MLLLIGNRQVAAGQDHRQFSRDRPQERRIALIIGNSAYTHAPRLQNPANDAKLMAMTLTRLGFEVVTGLDKSQREMKQMIREFGRQLRSGRTVSLFYFAGHGVQAKGRNFLIPVDADIQTEADLEDAAVDLNYVLTTVGDAESGLNITILDACRNNPLKRSFRSTQEGLAQVIAPTGTLIAYATAPNSVATDGEGENSPYTEELTRQMERPGILIETMFRRVAEQVSARTSGGQEPWYSANVKGDFYFAGRQPNVGSNKGSPGQTIKISEPDPQPDKGGARLLLNLYSIELQSCKMAADDVFCELKVTNITTTTREFALSHDDYRLHRRGIDSSKAITNEGNQYDLTESSIGSSNSRNALFNRTVLPPKVPVRMVLTFKDISESSTSFALLRLAVYQESTNNPSLIQYADFQNVMIEK
jgi:hypothetical protein